MITNTTTTHVTIERDVQGVPDIVHVSDCATCGASVPDEMPHFFTIQTAQAEFRFHLCIPCIKRYGSKKHKVKRAFRAAFLQRLALTSQRLEREPAQVVAPKSGE